MSRRATTLLALFALLLGTLLPTTVAAAESAPMPASMAAVGDSITQAASSAGSLGTDAPQNSWSTGTSTTVNSHYQRLLAAGAPISGRNYNRSVSGAKVADLNAQMQNVVALQPDYVTVLIGGNDVCTDTVAQMTSVTDFRARFQAAMSTLMAGSPNTHVYVVSIPNVYQLWELFRGNWWARFIWASADICQSLLANPTSTQQADVDRRAAVRQRNVDFNAQLAGVCATFERCLFDGNAVFNTPFTTADVSGDYFHPSVAGQAKLASVSWAHGFAFSAAPPPPPPPNEAPVADFGATCVDLTCTFTDASADDGTIVSHAWQFGDGSTASASDPTHTYAAAGEYTVTLTVVDDGGASDDASRVVTVTAPAIQVMYIESVRGDASAARNTWTAGATVKVVAGNGTALSNVTVTGAWSVGAGDTCTTGATGECRVVSDSFNTKKVASATFTVSGLTHATHAWDRGRDLATSVTVLRPA